MPAKRDPDAIASLDAIHRAAREAAGLPAVDDVYPLSSSEGERSRLAHVMANLFERSASARGLKSGTPEYEKAAEEAFRAGAERIKRAVDERPTKLQDPITYLALMGLAERIEKAAAERGHKEIALPLLGTLPSGRLNAMAVYLPKRSDAVILFETGLMMFASLITKVVVQTLKLDAVDDHRLQLTLLPDDWQPSPAMEERFLDVMRAMVVRGEPREAVQYFLPGDLQVVSDTIVESIELFIMGHELGHIHLGHFAQARHVQTAIGRCDTEEAIHSWEREFGADSFGFQIALTALGASTDPRLVLGGVQLFFTAVDLLIRGANILITGDPAAPVGAEESASHPPPSARRSRLEETFVASVPPSLASAAQNASSVLVARLVL